jgi:hypothetical protein
MGLSGKIAGMRSLDDVHLLHGIRNDLLKSSVLPIPLQATAHCLRTCPYLTTYTSPCPPYGAELFPIENYLPKNRAKIPSLSQNRHLGA